MNWETPHSAAILAILPGPTALTDLISKFLFGVVNENNVKAQKIRSADLVA